MRSASLVTVMVLITQLLSLNAGISAPGFSGHENLASNLAAAEELDELGSLPQLLVPQGFIENCGQVSDASVQFYLQTAGGAIAFLDASVLMYTSCPSEDRPRRTRAEGPLPDAWRCTAGGEGIPTSPSPVRLDFLGSVGDGPEGRKMLPGRCNYFIGDDPSRWTTDVPTYSEVAFPDLYPGIDLVYSTTDAGLKYTFIVHPEADPRMVRIGIEGHSGLSIEDGTILRIDTVDGPIEDSGLLAYQDGEPMDAVRCSFKAESQNVYSFELGPYDSNRPLVIDPFVHATFLSGYGNAYAYDLQVDGFGYVYVTGITYGNDIPSTEGAFQDTYHGGSDGFIAKFDANLSTLVFATYLGGIDDEMVWTLSVGPEGDVYVCGDTKSSDFPTSPNALYKEYTTNWVTGFVARLKSDGRSLVYSTYITGFYTAWGMDVDRYGCAYITGDAYDYLETTAGVYQPEYSGNIDVGICKLNAAGSAYIYSTYLGGAEYDIGYDVVLDSNRCAYLCGYTQSGDFPTMAGAPQRSFGGESDGIIAKLSEDAKALMHSTYLGGSGNDYAIRIALGPDGSTSVVGQTYSSDFPITYRAYQPHLGGGEDGFISTLSNNGTVTRGSTYYGGNLNDEFYGIDIDPDGAIIVCGLTFSQNLPATKYSPWPGLSGLSDGCMAGFTNDLKQLTFSTYIGGTGHDGGTAIDIVGSDRAFIAGYTSSVDFQVTPGAYCTEIIPESTVPFVAELSVDIQPPTADAGPDMAIDQHQTGHFNGTGSRDNVLIVDYRWTFYYDGNDTSLLGPAPDFLFDLAGVYAAILTVVDRAGLTSSDTVNITVRDITPPVAEAGADILIDQHGRASFDGSASSDNLPGLKLIWTFLYDGELRSLQGTYPFYVFDIAGSHSVQLNVTDNVGLWDVDEMTVVVRDTTVPVADAGPDMAIRQHQSFSFDGTGSSDNMGVVNWTWTFIYEDGPIALYGVGPSFRFDVRGLYIVHLTVLDSEGNIATDSMSLSVLDDILPIADAGQDLEVAQNSVFIFNGSGSTDNLGLASWKWTFEYNGSSVELDGINPEYTFREVGAYTVTLTVIDIDGNKATDTMIVHVLDSIHPIADAGSDVHISQYQAVSLDGSGSGDNLAVVNWTWEFVQGGAPVHLFGPTPTFLFDLAGIFEVTLTVTDAAGNHGTDVMLVHVRDTTPPTADAGPDITIDQFKEAVLEGSASSDNLDIVTWTWTFTYVGTPIVLSGRTQRFTFDNPGSYEITLTVQDAEGNSNSTILGVRVLDKIRPTINSPDHLSVKRGAQLTMDGSGATDNVGISRWVWSFRDAGKDVVLEGRTVQYAFSDAGDHKVTLTVYDADGNSAATTFIVSVKGGGTLIYAILLAVPLALVAVGAILVLRRRRK